jgi:hypothetical protein
MSYSPRRPRLPPELAMVLVDETVILRSARLAENVTSMKLLLTSVAL